MELPQSPALQIITVNKSEYIHSTLFFYTYARIFYFHFLLSKTKIIHTALPFTFSLGSISWKYYILERCFYISIDGVGGRPPQDVLL